MNWDYFIWFAVTALLCWAIGAVSAWQGKKSALVYGFTTTGLIIFLVSSYLCGFLSNALQCALWEKLAYGTLSFYH